MLNTPAAIGRSTVRNRIVFTAHLTGFAEDGLPSARHVAYYAERARTAGLVITEEHAVHPDDHPYEHMIRGHDPAVLPGYRALTEAVHAHGSLVLAQLNHNGPQASSLYSRAPVRGPVALPDPLFREVPVALTEADLDELVAAYADVARRCVDGGFDGVELQCSQASLLRCFLALPGVADRTGLLLRVLEAVRAELGDRILGVRLGHEDGVDVLAVARLLESRVDYLSTTVGVATSSLYLVEPSMHTAPGYAVDVAAAIRAAVGVPVVAVGRFTAPEQGETVLREGRADLVGFARGLIAGPRFERACVGCNQECVGRVGLNRPLGCAVNPRAGHELQTPRARTARRRVTVVGGGPAGLRAAATAAARGHAVTLVERERLGGQLALAAEAPGRAELGHVVRDLIAECRAAGVSLVDGEPDLDAEVVVLATGARPTRRWAAASDVRDVLDGSVSPSGSVLVVDELGFHHATSVAELLARRGCAVEIVTPGMVVGQDLGLTLDREGFRRRAHALGIRSITDTLVTDVGDAVTLVHHLTGRTEVRRYDAVVGALPPEPADELWETLRGRPGVYRIGDCLAPRRMDAAIRDGERVAVNL
ncbi:FAD-dependent oxidoreductase [Pseudonocardia sp. WMMC193]|uniref:oxidoreductase n=1 Tax=Pseudonocardia sp. WMMC193 TaxID=2911965 RepID=UPI001F38AFA9|nr:FAD-dependent oxidoreductase [Pseudonocardia sp. WMMC193]MCF7552866.1 FAD-dependent oxidoreductase [Pseudonocardia sp. WMMC193]